MQGKCQLNLDSRTGKYPPLLVQNGNFKYPENINSADERILYFGNKMLIKFVFVNCILHTTWSTIEKSSGCQCDNLFCFCKAKFLLASSLPVKLILSNSSPKSKVQTSVLGLGVDFVFPLSQQQEQEQQPPPKI